MVCNLYRYSLLALVLAMLALPGRVYAQDWDYGMWAGFSNYFGDLNTRTSFEYMGPGAGVFARYNFNTRLAWKNGFNFGKVSFSDEASPDPFQRARNLSFHSNILEITSQLEVNFFRFEPRKERYKFTPYLSFGVSGFYFNPKAELDGVTYALQPIGTEGQNDESTGKKPYSRFGFAIPVGGGFKYRFHPAWTLGVELGVRVTFTDYLDDVSTTYPENVFSFSVPRNIAEALSDRSGEVGEPIGYAGKQRGMSDKKDQFLFFGLSLSYTILKERCPWPSRIH